MNTVKYSVLFAVVLAVAVAKHIPASENKELSFEDNIARFIQEQEVSIDLPIVGSTVTLAARSLDSDELDVKVKLSNGGVEARKSKLKKIFAPILILVILKAITLIPLALGLLSLKTWNALQLSFVTFVISIALAVFQLCKKISWDHAHHPVISHSAAPWNAARTFNEESAQQLAYSGYVN